MTTARRFLWVLAILAAIGAVVVRKRSARPPLASPTWPPIEPATSAQTPNVVPPTPVPSVNEPEIPLEPDAAGQAPPHAAVTDIATDSGGDATEFARFIEPVDGTCPVSHPIKANSNSGIYHLPGGRFYDRTRAERCYAEAADAEADGYRAARESGNGTKGTPT